VPPHLGKHQAQLVDWEILDFHLSAFGPLRPVDHWALLVVEICP
jgi:hypothetical protein